MINFEKTVRHDSPHGILWIPQQLREGWKGTLGTFLKPSQTIRSVTPYIGVRIVEAPDKCWNDSLWLCVDTPESSASIPAYDGIGGT